MSASRAVAKRPRKRGRRPKTYAAVLEATTELLETTPLAELSVAQILAAAQVGRTSFYEHFSSKEDVVVKLVRGIVAEVAEGLEPMFDHGQRSAEAAFREGLGNWMRISARYRPLLVAAIEEWPTVPALRRLWFRTIDTMGARLAVLIEAERAAGLAPPGAPSQTLGATLAWGAERAFHIAMTGHHRTLTDEQALIQPLLQLYIGTIYGQPLHPPGADSAAKPS